MKLIHLSDLHIGKRVHEFSMIEDQKYILNQIVDIIKKENADGVIIAGDIYDKPVPSAEAVQVFDKFLTALAALKINIFAVSGNHDSAERIAFGAQLMRGTNVYMSPVYDGTIEKITMKDDFGTVNIFLLPFVKPAVVRNGLTKTLCDQRLPGEDENIEPNIENIDSYQKAVEAVIARMHVDVSERNVLVAHQFVIGASCCDSEELSVGGLDQISASVFDPFDYVALGHIHSPQKIGKDTIRYCGTPLKYSFSEADQEKSVSVVEIKDKGSVVIRTIPLKPLRDMRKIRGSYMEVTNLSFYKDTNKEDYVQITLTDEEDIPDCIWRLRTIYPNLMVLTYDNQRTRMNQQINAVDVSEQKSEIELFETFFQIQNNQSMTEEQIAFVKTIIEKL